MSQGSPFELTGKRIFITGGAGFLGTHFVHALSAAGADVVIGERAESMQAAHALAAEVHEQYGKKGEVVEIDVRSEESVNTVIDLLFSASSVDVVINNAAIDPKFDPSASANDRTFENYSEEAMKESVDVNMLGYWRVSKAAVRNMLKIGKGNIINISSIYGVTVPHQDIYPEGTQKPVDYGMTKSAVQYLTRYIAGTYGKQGIRSNALVLGGVYKGHDDEFVKKYGQYSMMGRMTLPEEVGAPLVFLVSDASQGVTGHLLAVDAGWSAW